MTENKRKYNVLITGGTRGIGRAIAMRLAECADTIIVNYVRNRVEAEKTRLMVEEKGAKCIPVKANMLYAAEIDRLFEVVEEHVEHLDVFVHCAALSAFKPISEIKPNQWNFVMNINTRAFLHCSQKCIPMMEHKTKGKIIALSSLGSIRVIPNYGALGPAKSAIESLVRYLAVELAPRGIQVNGVNGGMIETESISKFPDAVDLIKETTKSTPAGRIGTPDDIADVVVFLLSDSARWIYGQNIIVDGGLSLI
ncbi:MAG: SDR family oxidoreductase [FCB group bacterium]|nr:SDR family oxidoreductase [FCB group bacterium]